ncbi:ECF transporter S component [Konateibacter massiliensis]|uniref:ECF transporter S component n=1 Tax=Konateibacter massiliensis TaxID=2002841 RepID=UPI000C154FD7|nr:ECF transporter S component [Konateibacter massiliensis]
MNNKTKKLVIGALLAAFTTVATMAIKFPTPTFGYIHLGDGLVLLCGIILGPLGGALSAGIGSMFADIFSGYASFAPATLIIKAVTAMIAGFLFHRSKLKFSAKTLVAGIPAELFMVFGYFAYEIFLTMIAAQSSSSSSLAAAVTASAAGIPFNLAQGVAGIVIALALLPILMKIDEIREWISR